jgi:hypothetical protein
VNSGVGCHPKLSNGEQPHRSGKQVATCYNIGQQGSKRKKLKRKVDAQGTGMGTAHTIEEEEAGNMVRKYDSNVIKQRNKRGFKRR